MADPVQSCNKKSQSLFFIHLFLTQFFVTLKFFILNLGMDTLTGGGIYKTKLQVKILQNSDEVEFINHH